MLYLSSAHRLKKQINKQNKEQKLGHLDNLRQKKNIIKLNYISKYQLKSSHHYENIFPLHTSLTGRVGH